MIHKEKSKYAGKTVLLKKQANELGGKAILIEDWVDRIGSNPKSWKDTDNYPCLNYHIRATNSKEIEIPFDDEVLYGKIDGLGYVVHVNEINTHDKAEFDIEFNFKEIESLSCFLHNFLEEIERDETREDYLFEIANSVIEIATKIFFTKQYKRTRHHEKTGSLIVKCILGSKEKAKLFAEHLDKYFNNSDFKENALFTSSKIKDSILEISH